MDNPYFYTRLFQPSSYYKDGVNEKFLKAFRKFNYLFSTDPPKESAKTILKWDYPEQGWYKPKHYPILYTISKYIGVKIMYKDSIQDEDVLEGFYIIGDESRVTIANHILTHYFRSLDMYSLQIKENSKEQAKQEGFADVRGYASSLIDIELNVAYAYIKKLLVKTQTLHQNLEIYIMGQFKLDYKKYNQDGNTYYHAISKTYHHRRMLL